MSQIQAPKVVAHVATGSVSGEAVSSKVVAYLLLIPGEGGDDSNRQGHVHTQIMRRS